MIGQAWGWSGGEAATAPEAAQAPPGWGPAEQPTAAGAGLEGAPQAPAAGEAPFPAPGAPGAPAAPTAPTGAAPAPAGQQPPAAPEPPAWGVRAAGTPAAGPSVTERGGALPATAEEIIWGSVAAARTGAEPEAAAETAEGATTWTLQAGGAPANEEPAAEVTVGGAAEGTGPVGQPAATTVPTGAPGAAPAEAAERPAAAPAGAAERPAAAPAGAAERSAAARQDPLTELLQGGDAATGLIPLGALLGRTGRMLGASAAGGGAIALVVVEVTDAVDEDAMLAAAHALRGLLRFDDPLSRVGDRAFVAVVPLVPGASNGTGVERHLADAVRGAVAAHGPQVRTAHLVAELSDRRDADELLRQVVAKLRQG